MMDSILKDLRFALRGLLKRPGFTVIALVALALGIGANTAIFSLVNAVVLRPLPYPEPDELVWIFGNLRQGTNSASVSPVDFLDYREQNQSFEQLAATFGIAVPATLTGGGEPERLEASGVTGNYFDTFGVAPVLGRGFTLANERSGHDQVAILSHALWQRRFGGDPSILSKTIVVNGKPHEVIGVMGESATFPQAADLWLPMNFDGPEDPAMKIRFAKFIRPIGRLKPGVSLAEAQTDMDLIAARLEQQYPESNTGWSLRLLPLREQLVGGSRTTVLVLFGAVAFVLLIACANVANLLLVRAAARQKEIALRTALGASRWRIVRQMLTESLLLAIIGGALGALLAAWGVKLLVKLSEGAIPPTVDVNIDATVLGFTLLVSILTGVLFGLAPAFRTARVNLIDALKAGVRSDSQGSVRSRTRNVLVVLESAVAVMLLIGAGLLIRSLVALQQVNPGFDANNVLTLRVDLPQSKYGTPEKAASFFAELDTRVSGLPGVEAAGFVSDLPLSNQANDISLLVEGRPPVPQDQQTFADFRRVNHHYFRAMRIPLLRGRNFTEQEIAQSAKVLIVSQQLVDVVFPNEDPLGKRLITGMKGELYEIIGVVGDLRHTSLAAPVSPAMYFPTRERPMMNLVIRTQGDPLSIAGAVRNEVRSMNPDLPISAVKPMAEWIDSSVATPRYRTTLFGLFAALAMILAATGIYGVMSYTVAQRTHEIGVRMALGARRMDVLKLVVRQGMVLTVIGVIVGLIGAFALTRVMESLLFGVTTKDPITFTVVAVLLLAVAFIACFVPARRATKVDPLVALRYE
ncbi:MAG TPA: ABC transporter permease [Pyrinomonadaceae bacterium]|nr:ABC transporter permease [Pyrinomonadaceae bacterium]